MKGKNKHLLHDKEIVFPPVLQTSRKFLNFLPIKPIKDFWEFQTN